VLDIKVRDRPDGLVEDSGTVADPMTVAFLCRRKRRSITSGLGSCGPGIEGVIKI